MKALIVGRSNVGKSSLFNRIAKKKKSLVFDETGITRDVLKEDVEWWGQSFTIIDSGGFPEKGDTGEIHQKIQEQIDHAIKETDVCIIVTDGRSGLHSEDEKIVRLIQKTGKPSVIFVNKIDNPKNEQMQKAEFFELSDELISGSAEQEYGIDELIEWIVSKKDLVDSSSEGLIESSEDLAKKQTDKHFSLFIIGKANSGKSLLCNQILNKERMIVSSQAGTTLDTVTEIFSKGEDTYTISDNPGSRKGKREEREKLSFAKSRSEIENSDMVLLVIDGVIGPSRQDTRLIKLCLEKHKPVIAVINKMDLLKSLDKEDREQKRIELEKTFHFCEDLPIVFVSAKTGYNKEKLFKLVSEMKKKISLRISTSSLNNFFTKTIRKAPAPVYGTSDVKFYYITQTKKQPPDFIAFANYPKGVTPAYKRFIINQIKDHWNLKGIPIGFHVLSKR